MTVRDIDAAIKKYVPKYYRDIKESKAILDSEVKVILDSYDSIHDVIKQFDVDNATWGLDKWADFLGVEKEVPGAKWGELENREILFSDIEVLSWEDLTYKYDSNVDNRRSKIKSKIRGSGTVTRSMLKNVAESYLNGDVEIQEDYSNFKVIITFVGKRGIPTNLDSIKNAIREILPAHLIVEYRYVYTNFGQLTSYNLTFGQLKSKGLTFEGLGRYSQ